MIFKDDNKKNNITDFIEQNEQNNLDKQSNLENTLIIKKEDLENTQKIDLKKDTAKQEDENTKNINSNQDDIKITQKELSKEEIDEKVKDFYKEDTYTNASCSEYNSSGIKHTSSPSFEDDFSHSNIYIKKHMYAGFWLRAFAFLMDYFLVLGIKNIIDFAIGVSPNYIIEKLSYVILFCLYNFIFVYLSNGYTVGKIFMNIKVVEKNNSNIRFFTALTREFVGKYILIKIPIIFLFLVFSEKKHHLIDYLSDTQVIKEKYEQYYEEFENIT